MKITIPIPERFRFITKRILLLCFAAFLTLTSAFLISGLFPIRSKSILYNIDYRYANRNNALLSLSDLESREFNMPDGIVSYNSSYITPIDLGFREMLSLIKQKRPVPYADLFIKQIVVIRIGAQIQYGRFDLTPQYILGVGINDYTSNSPKIESITLLYEGELESWIDDEEQRALNNISLIGGLGAVLIKLLLSLESELS